MRLAELSPAEQDFLDAPLRAVDDWTPQLTQRLARLLKARLKQSVEVLPVASHRGAAPARRAMPEIVADNVFEALWLHARLGGRVRGAPTRGAAPCTALSRNLQRSLQHMLAEAWLSTRHPSLPDTLIWRIETQAADNAMLTIHFPTSMQQMTQWAQRVIAS